MINKKLCIKHTGNMLHLCINNYTATYMKHNFNSVIYHLSCNKFSFLLGILNNISVRTLYVRARLSISDYILFMNYCSKIIIPTYILFLSFMQLNHVFSKQYIVLSIQPDISCSIILSKINIKKKLDSFFSREMLQIVVNYIICLSYCDSPRKIPARNAIGDSLFIFSRAECACQPPCDILDTPTYDRRTFGRCHVRTGRSCFLDDPSKLDT